MNRNGILMAIWILAALTLVASLSMADRGDRGNRDRDREQAKSDQGNSHQATPATPAPQARTSSQPAARSTYTPPSQSSGNSGRSGGYGWSGRSSQSTAAPASGGWQSHRSSQGSAGSSRWQTTSRPTYTPPAGSNASTSTWRSRSTGGAGGAATTYQPKPSFTPAAPSAGASTGQSWRSRTTGGQAVRDRVSTSAPDRPSFTQGSQAGGWKAGGDHSATVEKPVFTPQGRSGDGGAQGSGQTGSWRDRVRGGTPSGSRIGGGGTLAKPEFGPQGQGSGQPGSWRDRVRGGTPSGGRIGGSTLARPEYGTQAGHGQQGSGDHSTFAGAQGDHRGRPQFKVDGQRLDFTQEPRQHDGHWAAPVRPFFDRIGARMWEDRNDNYWHARRGDHEFRFRCGDRRGWFDGREIIFSFAPYLFGGYLYCPLDTFATYFGVRYETVYVPEPYPVYMQGPEVSKGLAIATASEYLRNVGAYPIDVADVDAHQNSAPANRFWDLVTTGHDPIPDAPMVWCWVVEFDYPGGWQQVFIDARTGEVVGGSAS